MSKFSNKEDNSSEFLVFEKITYEVWKNKITILFFIIIFFSLSVIYLHLTPNSYKSRINNCSS